MILVFWLCLFWLCLFLICSCYFGYPLVLIILGQFFTKSVKKAEITPSVSLLIPAYNEEKVIAQKIENCLSSDYPKEKLEIVVASESTDKTNEIVKKYKDKGIKLFAYPKREGKSFLIYKTVPQCRGEILVFTDANAIFKNDVLKKLVRNFAEPKIGCVCGELKYVNPKETAIGESEGFYWKYEIFLKKQESKIQSVLGANGSIYALRKNLYSPLSKYRGDDFELPIRVKQQGYGVVFENVVFSFEEGSQRASQEFQRKIRIVSQFLKSALILLKKSFFPFQPILIFQLLFHKILRWLAPLFLILIFLSNIFLLEEPFYQLTMSYQIIFYGTAIFGWQYEKKGKKLNRVINLIYYFSMVNLAALIGLFKGIAGKQRPYWQKVR